jgi:hypothetical protein
VLIVLLLPLYYFTRVVNDFLWSFTYAVFYVAIICVLQYFRRKSGFKIPQFVFSRYQLNTLTPEGRLLIAFSFGFFFAGILLVIVTELIGPLPIIPRVLFFVSLLIIGTIIADTIRKALQNTKMAF